MAGLKLFRSITEKAVYLLQTISKHFNWHLKMNHWVTFQLLWNGSVANEPGQQKDVHFVFTPLLILAPLLPLRLPHFPQQLVFLLPPFFLLPPLQHAGGTRPSFLLFSGLKVAHIDKQNKINLQTFNFSLVFFLAG